MLRNRSLQQILADTHKFWDHHGTRPDVRQNFLKIIDCGTLALGADIYESETERLLVCGTCKSRFCPSCGYRATVLWQNELEAMLPDISYVGINFTMPSVFWPVFQQNRHLLNDLPAIGASAIQRWVENKYGVSVLLIVVPQTFGGLLNFNPHLHMLVSAGGFQESENKWISLHFDKRELMQMWRLALLAYLWVALRAGSIWSGLGPEKLRKVLEEQYKRDWIIYISPFMSKAKFLRYAGRYIRRPPIPLNHILKITDAEVQFLAKDTRAKRVVELMWPKKMFVETLAEHVPDRYRHAMRYFGLLAPRSKRRTLPALFALLKQEKRCRPARLSWADSLCRDFGVNPRVDASGQLMRWTGRLKPHVGQAVSV
jgi:Putative transposase/Transposase zinc-binding domain